MQAACQLIHWTRPFSESSSEKHWKRGFSGFFGQRRAPRRRLLRPFWHGSDGFGPGRLFKGLQVLQVLLGKSHHLPVVCGGIAGDGLDHSCPTRRRALASQFAILDRPGGVINHAVNLLFAAISVAVAGCPNKRTVTLEVQLGQLFESLGDRFKATWDGATLMTVKINSKRRDHDEASAGVGLRMTDTTITRDDWMVITAFAITGAVLLAYGSGFGLVPTIIGLVFGFFSGAVVCAIHQMSGFRRHAPSTFRRRIQRIVFGFLVVVISINLVLLGMKQEWFEFTVLVWMATAWLFLSRHIVMQWIGLVSHEQASPE